MKKVIAFEHEKNTAKSRQETWRVVQPPPYTIPFLIQREGERERSGDRERNKETACPLFS